MPGHATAPSPRWWRGGFVLYPCRVSVWCPTVAATRCGGFVMRCGVVVCAVTVVLVAVSGCGGGGKAAPSAAPSVAVTSPAAPAGVKLSTKWAPKFTALSAEGGTAACQTAGSSACATAISATLAQLNAFMDDVNSTGAGKYPASVAQVQKMVNAAQGYSSAGCEGGTASSCYGDAMTLTVGVPTLDMALATDETKAGN